MPDTQAPLDPRQSWLRHMGRIGAAHGFFNRISSRHMALFVDEGDTLVLSFDRADRTWDQGDRGLPLGFDCLRALEFSLLSILSAGQTWFRDAAVETLLQGLVDDGFFASYKTVLIIANGPDCGHAAARAARFVPGAQVLLNRPAAATSATHAPFERRFKASRQHDPDTPPPLGPEALQTAASTTILFDPKNPSEAAQAALFRAPNTARVGLPYSGSALEHTFTKGEVLVPLARLMQGKALTPAKARKILRPSLRRDPDYLARLSAAAIRKGHVARAATINDNAPETATP
ncbi:hypothetical protein [Gymnodinialimonas ceratoperidinii]|uniref:Uncharacterized protein n=1 Tax=Gymnodinialimonas ceratoperidinii TaxID=2856823 RepID=A0A8F6TU87_9RHOB|nr:hypothetical protein [Gymnodinialimonas ceratoperidinii]QXT38810.1 hypothetical protein KYE46_12815 [Gymnodinialimonas ceratoperidinii]